jgi:hypothetical protein
MAKWYGENGGGMAAASKTAKAEIGQWRQPGEKRAKASISGEKWRHNIVSIEKENEENQKDNVAAYAHRHGCACAAALHRGLRHIKSGARCVAPRGSGARGSAPHLQRISSAFATCAPGAPIIGHRDYMQRSNKRVNAALLPVAPYTRSRSSMLLRSALRDRAAASRAVT